MNYNGKESEKDIYIHIYVTESLCYIPKRKVLVAQLCLFATPWTTAHQAPLSIEFSKREYWREFPFPSPGDLHNPGIEPWVSCVAGRVFTI